MTTEEGNVSSISRRSLLGYSGTAAAGAVLAGSGTAAADAEQSTETVQFPMDTEFTGSSSIGDIDAYLSLTFTLSVEASAEHGITPAEVANALSELAVSRGWPPITFYGRPAAVAVN